MSSMWVPTSATGPLRCSSSAQGLADQVSFFLLPGVSPSGSAEEVTTNTLGSYAERAGLEQITLVKIDTEGHDLAVLRGARELFESQRISVARNLSTTTAGSMRAATYAMLSSYLSPRLSGG